MPINERCQVGYRLVHWQCTIDPLSCISASVDCKRADKLGISRAHMACSPHSINRIQPRFPKGEKFRRYWDLCPAGSIAVRPGLGLCQEKQTCDTQAHQRVAHELCLRMITRLQPDRNNTIPRTILYASIITVNVPHRSIDMKVDPRTDISRNLTNNHFNLKMEDEHGQQLEALSVTYNNFQENRE